ncbi:guanosine nucleotide diphosphate dissociation inhibitor At5g09550-like [Hibiscus syriacus]|uniref:guanosine nucleotide diphosphate dissociation inhibitor At5g09550-like n=1 Tax=Hibiscus syriacus TaxID=106335 RepID=UPI0019248B89|nr:guanosine nucleotide diphosphate dissociation inhibitor At5g09550-like [Hibiscus syriacus]
MNDSTVEHMLQQCTHLDKLSMYDCSDIRSLTEVNVPLTLKHLVIRRCDVLDYSKILLYTSLESLDIEGSKCHPLVELSLPSFPLLKRVSIGRCEDLKFNGGLGGGALTASIQHVFSQQILSLFHSLPASSPSHISAIYHPHPHPHPRKREFSTFRKALISLLPAEDQSKIYKVPATDVEALKSQLMGLFEKRRARKFFIYVQDYDDNDPKSHEGLDLNKVTARELISKYGLEDDTIDFIGHALALYSDDSYLDQPALDFVKRMKLYAESLARFQGGSPYIYPLGLGELPQAFARLSAVYGGTYMLNKPECKVEFGDDGKVIGVTSEGETAKCKKVVCDPSYLSDRIKKVGKVARAICIMSHPIPDTNESHSAQVILPQKQLGRKSDMYLFCCSYAHNVAPKGKYIAFVSTEAETEDPKVELEPGIKLLGLVDEIFYDTYDRYVPTNDHAADNCFISASYDPTTHFETTVNDVIQMYTKITGKVLDLSVDLSAASASEE